MTLATLLCVIAFASVHLFVGHLRFLEGVPRSRWLSMAGGIAVAYVFLHVLPELGAHQAEIGERMDSGWLGRLEHEIYLVAFLGLAAFYGLERIVRGSRADRTDWQEEDRPDPNVFWLHSASFAVYNLLIGYLIVHREDDSLGSLAFYGIAMAFHFLTNDFGLREDYKRAYDDVARWVFAAAVALGWGLGLGLDLSETAVGLLFAFLAGGVVLNVMKEELPEERQSRFLPFAGGAGVFAALLLLAA